MSRRRGPGRPPAKAVQRRRVAEQAHGIVVRSEGQRLLLEVDATVKQIGAACGVVHQTVVDWRYGRKTPAQAARAALWSAYEIPAPAWGRLPLGMQTDPDGVPVPPPSSLTTATPAPPSSVTGDAGGGISPDSPPHTNGHARAAVPNSLDETSALLAQIRRQLASTDLLASDRARITDTYTKTLALQHRLQKEADLTEDRIVRDHPTWQRIRLELARVLARYPDVANEVCEALERLGM